MIKENPKKKWLSTVFWDRFDRIKNIERILAQIERGEAKIQQRVLITKALERNVNSIEI